MARAKQITVLSLTGLILAAISSLVWNVQHFKLDDSLREVDNVLRLNSTATTLELHQPQLQEQILPDADTATIHTIKDSASDSSYRGDLNEFQADTALILTYNSTLGETIAGQYTEWRNDKNVVHVILTRFMQTQPHLVALGQARLRLFTALTVPSMQYQTQQQFLWIIRTDPDLHPSILEPLMETVAKLQNTILVASNRNPEGFRDSDCMSDITPETLLVGSMEYVHSYHRSAQTHTVLETRCDADDALAIDFVELMQQSATTGLYPLNTDWIVYCIENHMEWQYDNPWANNALDAVSNSISTNQSTLDEKLSSSNTSVFIEHERGALLVLQAGHCVTPGLTWGYSINASRRDLPVTQHHKIQRSIKSCGSTNRKHNNQRLQTKCLLKLGDEIPLALRARTPTSAGMSHVFVANQTEETFEMEQLQQSKARILQNELFNKLFVLFGVDSDDLYHVRKHISEHFAAIVKDALAGQCTKGHSCKDSSKKILLKLIKATDRPEQRNNTVGTSYQ